MLKTYKIANTMLKLNKTYSIEGLTEDHMNLIDSLLSHVRLGNNPEALELNQFLEGRFEGNLSITATDDDGHCIPFPILDVQ